jgi:hypothetical protein
MIGCTKYNMDDLIWKIVGGVIVALLAIAIVDSILSSAAAPQPGDPLYPALQSMISGWSTALVLAVPGSILVLAYVLSQLRGM